MIVELLNYYYINFISIHS